MIILLIEDLILDHIKVVFCGLLILELMPRTHGLYAFD